MRQLCPNPNVRPEARPAGVTNGGSLIGSRSRNPFSSAEEMELASELLEVTSEGELDQFLGALFKKAWRGVGPVGPKVITPLAELLKTAAKKALPSVTTASTSFSRPAGDAIAEKLGSLINRALEAEVAGIAATDRDLEKCRKLLEKYRQFVRLAGTATKAAASAAPTGADPIAAARKSLADFAKEKLMQKGPPATATGRPVSAVRAVAQGPRTGTQAPGGRSCSICELPSGSCRCKMIRGSGRWIRDGNNIVVNC